MASGPHFSADAREAGADLALRMLRRKPRTIRAMGRAAELAGELSEPDRDDFACARVILTRWGLRAGVEIDPYGEWL